MGEIISLLIQKLIEWNSLPDFTLRRLRWLFSFRSQLSTVPIGVNSPLQRPARVGNHPDPDLNNHGTCKLIHPHPNYYY